MSNSLLTVCNAATTARQHAATKASAHLHPNSTVTMGTRAPASAVPAGTPVCFNEKMNLRLLAETALASKCELAGVMGP